MSLILVHLMSQNEENGKEIYIKKEDFHMVFQIKLHRNQTPLIGEKPMIGSQIWLTDDGRRAQNVQETPEYIASLINQDKANAAMLKKFGLDK